VFFVAAMVFAAMNNMLVCGLLFILSGILYGTRKLIEQKEFWAWGIIVALLFIYFGIRFLLMP